MFAIRVNSDDVVFRFVDGEYLFRGVHAFANTVNVKAALRGRDLGDVRYWSL